MKDEDVKAILSEETSLTFLIRKKLIFTIGCCLHFFHSRDDDDEK